MLIIEVKKGNVEGALKKFKSKVIKTKLVSQLQDRKTYKKKSDVKRQIIKDAIYKQKKKSQNLEKFKFVLDHKIKELKRDIGPREEEIIIMK